VIEGFFIFRRVLMDSNGYGVGVNFDATGLVDELGAIYAAGAGADPCLTTGSWDCEFGLPTNSTIGQLTADGQAWSHPHGSSLINQDLSFPWDGGYLGGSWMVYFDGVDDEVNFGSDASLDNIPNGQSITVDGVFRIDETGPQFLIGKNTSSGNGWYLTHIGTNLRVNIDCATDAISDITPASVGLDSFADGKCRHIAFVYDDTGDKTIYIAVDGVWASAYVAQTAGVGAYVGDAAMSLYTGEQGGTDYDLLGAHGWLHINGARLYTPGTDFIVPRTLVTDGNTIEAWDVDQGTGNLTASINSPANDGVRTGATWISVWDQQLTPVVPQSLQFFMENDGVNFQSGANIDDLLLADATIEIFANIPADVIDNAVLLSKGNIAETAGWQLRWTTATMFFRAQFATTDLVLNFGTGWNDGECHHFAIDFDFGTLTARSFVDGVYVASYTAAGAYQSDAALNCIVNGLQSHGSGARNWATGPIRLSNSRRYTGNSFVPPARTNWPWTASSSCRRW